MNYSIALSIADYLVGELKEHCLPGYCRIAGGLRREKADVHDIEIVRNTWRTTLYCGTCGTNTAHVGRKVANMEIYKCTVCQTEKWYTVT